MDQEGVHCDVTPLEKNEKIAKNVTLIILNY